MLKDEKVPFVDNKKQNNNQSWLYRLFHPQEMFIQTFLAPINKTTVENKTESNSEVNIDKGDNRIKQKYSS